MTQDAAAPADLAGRVLHRDGLVIILDKPAGIAVHPGPSGGPSLEDGFDSLRFGLPRRPCLAHRLDRDTAGCLALGRHPKALRRLGRIFAAGLAEKIYWAVADGLPPEPEGRIAQALAKRSTAGGGWRMELDPEGQAAATRWRTLGTAEGLAWIAFRPETGRTHQIRVHAAALGCPLLGDPLYGRPRPGALRPPLHLLARRLALPLQADRPPVAAEAEPPEHMRAALVACGWSPGAAIAA